MVVDPNWQISCVRTVVVPLTVGVVVQWLCFLGATPSSILRVLVTFLAAVAWYSSARWAQYRSPYFGFLLGVAARPHYDDEDGLAPSIRRTLVPLAVATAISCLVAVFVGGSTAALCLVAVALAYYGTLRWVEHRSAPYSTARSTAGLLLGARAVLYY